MASTLTKILIHITFSTKGRVRIIAPAWQADLYSYIGGICRNMDSPLLTMNGMEDHVHMLVSLGKTVPLSDLMLNVKRESSKWVKQNGTRIADFGWQDGYFGFSIGESGVADLRKYIANQRVHHSTQSFQDEVRHFLRKYGIEWDERYVWD